ncbi:MULTISPECIES: methyltransferase [unclassified Microcoleus]|uniref:methyltransferase n=1 Tax=unclassified Microcoleus TaxID=2642155 RepID=UPI002FD17C9F
MSQPETNQPTITMPPQLAMLQMASGYWVSQSIYVAAKLGIADLLKDSPKSCDELATATGTNARSLYRLLRALASLGVFAETQPHHFTLTPVAACLQTDVPGSLRALAIMLGEENYRAWGNLRHGVQTGGSPFEQVYGMNIFEYYAQNLEPAKIFDEAMTNFSALKSAAIAASYDFSSIQTLVDVGGGQGLLIASILKSNPTMKGILFDRPYVIENAKPFIEAEGVLERCQLAAGNFFESVPEGGDAYILKHIIHDWDDERAIAILKQCHKVMPANGKVLVAEQVIPPGNEPFMGKLLDLNMLVMAPGGCERTQAEYRALFETAGFKLTRIVPTQEEVSIIEGIRV